jgi:hypothetical protein
MSGPLACLGFLRGIATGRRSLHACKKGQYRSDARLVRNDVDLVVDAAGGPLSAGLTTPPQRRAFRIAAQAGRQSPDPWSGPEQEPRPHGARSQFYSTPEFNSGCLPAFRSVLARILTPAHQPDDARGSAENIAKPQARAASAMVPNQSLLAGSIGPSSDNHPNPSYVR